MKKMIQKASIVLFALFTLGASAQDQGNALDSSGEKKNAVAAYFGLPGFGVGYARKFTDHTALRVAGTFAGFKRDMNDIDVGDRKINASASWKFNKIDLLFDYTPFKESSFKLVAGLAYIYNGKTTVSAVAAEDETVTVGGITETIKKEDLGGVNALADWTGVAPYIATGFGRAVPKNNVGFGFELGGYFIGSPETSYQSYGLTTVGEDAGLVNVEEESKDFKDAVSKLKFMPSLMFHFTIKL